MKARFLVLIAATLILMSIASCDKVKDPEIVTVILGAQGNAAVDGYYAVEENKTYTMAEAADNQAMIDIFCFYELETGNNIAIASPGSGITGIFTGDDAPANWTTQNTTRFFQTTLTEEQFTAVQDGDALIESAYNSTDSRKKAKDLQVGQVWSFLTADNIYGLLYVTAVSQGADGKATFVLKTKKVLDVK